MKLKWDGKFKKAKETNNWFWWALFGVVVLMVVAVILKMLERI